jgi:hypothetical protein
MYPTAVQVPRDIFTFLNCRTVVFFCLDGVMTGEPQYTSLDMSPLPWCGSVTLLGTSSGTPLSHHVQSKRSESRQPYFPKLPLSILLLLKLLLLQSPQSRYRFLLHICDAYLSCQTGRSTFSKCISNRTIEITEKDLRLQEAIWVE